MVIITSDTVKAKLFSSAGVDQSKIQNKDVPVVGVGLDSLKDSKALGDAKTPNESKFRSVFKTQEGYDEFRKFLTNIFMQLDEDKFETLMKDILSDDKLDTDEKIYEVLYSRIGEAKKGVFGKTSFGLGKLATTFAALRSLGRLKGDLAQQVKNVMGDITKIDGYLEIGYPGRMIRPIMGKLKMNGPILVVNDGEDVVQRGFPFTKPYNKVVPLNDYAPISKDTAADSSLDMVSCFIGLHHTPNENGELDAFVDSIERVLRPGGTFILMDHNAKTQQLNDLCWVVHGVFNAATGVKPAEDKKEYRDFHSIGYWSKYLYKHGFELVTETKDYQVRKGDPTQNTVVRFRKFPKTLDQMQEAVQRSPGYAREGWKTYSSIPEWYNVGYSKAYGDFLQGHDMNDFSFMKHMVDFWKVLGNSWNAARQHSGFWELMGSDFIMMDVFIGVTMTLECLFRSMASAPLRLLNSHDRQGATNKLKEFLAKDAKEYGAFIDHTPFYNYPYFKQVKQFWAHYIQSLVTGNSESSRWNNPLSRESLGNLYLTILMSMEYLAKGVTSAPIAWMYGSGSLKEAEKIGMLISCPEKNVQKASISEFDKRIELKEQLASNGNLIEHIENPRYLPNTQIMIELSKQGVNFINIAGQTKVAMKVAVDKNIDKQDFAMKGCAPKFEYIDPRNNAKKYVVMEVEVPELHSVLFDLTKKGFDSIHVHDF